MAFKMKGFPKHNGVDLKDKRSLDVKPGSAADKKHKKFLDEQHEESVKSTDYLTKTPVGPRVKEGAPKKQDHTNVPLSEHEKKSGVIVTGGSKNEEINDLEDRIEYLESDIADAGQEGPTKLRAQLMKLKQQLAKLRGN